MHLPLPLGFSLMRNNYLGLGAGPGRLLALACVVRHLIIHPFPPASPRPLLKETQESRRPGLALQYCLYQPTGTRKDRLLYIRVFK